MRRSWAILPALFWGCTTHAFGLRSSLVLTSSFGREGYSFQASSRPHLPLLFKASQGKARLNGGFRGGGVTMAAATDSNPEDKLVMYLVVRSDLGKDKPWPQGSVIAQGAHAATKALWEFRDNDNVKLYCDEINSMHKVVLAAKNEKQLRDLAQDLETKGVACSLWLEQPENEATALATMPYPRSMIKPMMKGLQLFK